MKGRQQWWWHIYSVRRSDLSLKAKVLIVEPAGNLWGSERALLDLLRRLIGLDFAVCCPPGTLIVDELRSLGVRVFPTFIANLHEKSKVMRLWALVGLVRACFLYRPNLIYLNQAGCYRIARLAALLQRVRVITHVRIFEDAEYLARCRPSPSELRGIIAISHAIADHIMEYDALRQLRIEVIYDGYQQRNGSCEDEVDHASTNRTHIACVGRITPIKGQDMLLEALAILQSRGTRVSCSFIGDGNAFSEELKTTAAAERLSQAIQWLGFQQDVFRILQGCNLLAVPSHREPLGRVIFEGWDAGCIPLAFRGSGGAAEVITASQGGLLYDEQTPASLAECIATALTLDLKERATILSKGRRWMASHCSPVRYACAIRRVFVTAIAHSNV